MRQPWHERYTLPPSGNVMPSGEKSHENFIRIANEIARDIHGAINKYYGDVTPETKILDFGCGVGRVAMPLYHEHGYPSHCVDVSPWCVGYLKKQLTEISVQVTGNLPPLPFEDNAFDVVYAVSVWTHLPFERQWPWLREINRVLKMGGIALITTSGQRALRYRREQRKQEGWLGITDDDLKLEGIIYKDCDPKNHDGIESKYGYVAHDADWLRGNWGRLFEYVDFLPAAITSMQDLNVLRKIRDVKPSDLVLIGLENGV